jgi:hypothetical protein
VDTTTTRHGTLRAERERLYGHLEVGVPVITTVDRGVRGAAYLA